MYDMMNRVALLGETVRVWLLNPCGWLARGELICNESL